MARPPEVTDEEIIEVGIKLRTVGHVNGYRLFDALGRRGRSDRLLKVWQEYEATLARTADDPSIDLPPVPEKAQMLADGLKGELAGGIDRAIKLIYAAVEEGVRGRYRDELAETISTRDACTREVAEALGALGDLSENLAVRDETIESLSAMLETTKAQRDRAEAVNGAELKHQEDLAARLTKAESSLNVERQKCVDLQVLHGKMEEVIGLLRAEKAAWLEERDRFRAIVERKLVEIARLETESRKQLSTNAAQQATTEHLDGSATPRTGPPVSSVFGRRIGTMEAFGSDGSYQPPRPRRLSLPSSKTAPARHDTAVTSKVDLAPTDGRLGGDAP